MSTAAVRICLSELAATRITRPDSELLSQYTLRGDQDAFAQLVRRHGPVVLAACRRVLGPTPDAEDAFQTTFLALARHAVFRSSARPPCRRGSIEPPSAPPFAPGPAAA